MDQQCIELTDLKTIRKKEKVGSLKNDRVKDRCVFLSSICVILLIFLSR